MENSRLIKDHSRFLGSHDEVRFAFQKYFFFFKLFGFHLNYENSIKSKLSRFLAYLYITTLLMFFVFSIHFIKNHSNEILIILMCIPLMATAINNLTRVFSFLFYRKRLVELINEMKVTTENGKKYFQ